MKCFCHIEFTYPSKKQAKAIQQALEVDDKEFVSSIVMDTILKAEIHSKKISSLRHSLDDYLSCIQVAETIVGQHEKKEKK